MGVRLELVVAEDIPHVINNDATRLRQVLGNMLNYALQETGKEGLRIELRTAEGMPGTLRFEIHIAESLPGNRRTERGTGIDVAEMIVKAMHGHLGIEDVSEHSRGYWFSFPWSGARLHKPETKPEVSTTTPAPVPAKRPDSRPAKILVVEDEMVSRRVATAFIKMLGCESLSMAAKPWRCWQVRKSI